LVIEAALPAEFIELELELGVGAGVAVATGEGEQEEDEEKAHGRLSTTEATEGHREIHHGYSL
jgi:hypothetical protein